MSRLSRLLIALPMITGLALAGPARAGGRGDDNGLGLLLLGVGAAVVIGGIIAAQSNQPRDGETVWRPGYAPAPYQHQGYGQPGYYHPAWHAAPVHHVPRQWHHGHRSGHHFQRGAPYGWHAPHQDHVSGQ